MADKDNVERKQTQGGETGSTPDMGDKVQGGAEQGAKSTEERVEKQEHEVGGEGNPD